MMAHLMIGMRLSAALPLSLALLSLRKKSMVFWSVIFMVVSPRCLSMAAENTFAQVKLTVNFLAMLSSKTLTVPTEGI